MVQIAEKLIEAVHGGQVFVAITLVIFAKLSGGVAKALHHGGHRDVGFLPTFRGTVDADLGHSSADGDGAVDECGAAGGARLLTVIVGEENSFFGDPVNVGRLIAHHAVIIIADVFGTDVIAPNYEDIRLFCCATNEPEFAKIIAIGIAIE